MKLKIIIFSICNLVICNLLIAQNITNTLGSNGMFTIKDGTTNYLSLSQSTGNLTLNNSLLMSNTTSSTTGVLFKGLSRFLHNFGTGNTFLGFNSGNFTMTGLANTGLGSQSLQSISSGSYNTAIGNNSLFSNSTGSYNTAVGFNSLYTNTTGIYNTAVGYQSLGFNTIGSFNTALGYLSLNSNTNGVSNVAIGNGSLNYNITGDNNTAVGTFSLRNNKGSDNTAVGFNSLSNNVTGYRNTSLGMNSLIGNSSGYHNTALGYYSLYSNSTGNENTAVGYNSLYSNTTNAGNTAVGWNALYLNTGYQNTAVGHHSMNSNTTGNYNTSIGYNSGSTITTGLNLTCIGIDAAPTTPTATDQITLGNGFVTSLRCNVTTITSLSDMRDKKNIKDLTIGLDFITKLHPRQFNWDKREWYDSNKSDGSKMDSTYTAGFIAQELDEVQTTENAEWLKLVLKDNPEKWEATPGNLLPIMVKAIQQLKEENDRLKIEIEILKTENKKTAELEVMFLQLKEKIGQLEAESQNVRITNK